jgi:hypothetical protein
MGFTCFSSVIRMNYNTVFIACKFLDKWLRIING